MMLRSNMLIILLPMLLVVRHATSSFQNNQVLLERALIALDKVLDFALKYSYDFNQDAILNMNVGQSHLRKTISKTKDPKMLERLHKLIQKSENVYKLGPHVNKSDPVAVIFQKYIVPPENWERDIEFSYGKLQSNPKINTDGYNVVTKLGFMSYIYTTIDANSMSSKPLGYSDKCISQVANLSNNTQPHDCPISQECYHNMIRLPNEFSDKYGGYLVTHMLWLLQIARSRNCNINYKTFKETVRKECSYIYWELRKNVELGYISELDDLLFEQISFCGFEGFGEFLTENLLEHVLAIQDPHGCFGMPGTPIEELIETGPKLLRRPKRFCKFLKYDCTDHITGFGVTVLSLFVRVFIENQT